MYGDDEKEKKKKRGKLALEANAKWKTNRKIALDEHKRKADMFTERVNNPEQYHEDIGYSSDFVSFMPTKADSIHFYGLHKKIGDYVKERGGIENVSELEKKHINDILYVTERIKPVKQIDPIAKKVEDYPVMEKIPKQIGRLTKSVLEMSNEELELILDTDYSQLKGKSIVDKVGLLFDLKPEKISYLDMISYGRYMMSDDFKKRFFGNMRRANKLGRTDIEYQATYKDK
jgi:hypothetical protein